MTGSGEPTRRRRRQACSGYSEWPFGSILHKRAHDVLYGCGLLTSRARTVISVSFLNTNHLSSGPVGVALTSVTPSQMFPTSLMRESNSRLNLQQPSGLAWVLT